MTKDEYTELVNFIEEWIPLEQKEGFKPRFQYLKDVLREEMDWATMDALVTDAYNEFLKDYAVLQVRNRNER